MYAISDSGHIIYPTITGKGVTCKKEIEVEDGPVDTRIEIIDIFVPSGEVCDGVKHCMDGEDEQNCPYGYYCMNQKDKFVPYVTLATTSIALVLW